MAVKKTNPIIAGKNFTKMLFLLFMYKRFQTMKKFQKAATFHDVIHKFSDFRTISYAFYLVIIKTNDIVVQNQKDNNNSPGFLIILFLYFIITVFTFPVLIRSNHRVFSSASSTLLSL